MRTLLFVSLFLMSHVLLAQRYSSYIKDLPRPAREVNDFGDFLTYRERNNLETQLISYRKKTGNSIVIITLSTLPFSIKETSLQYFNKWGIGDLFDNNGVLLLVSRYPRRVRITTGSGIDDILTDNDCQRIIDETIVPSFKERMFYTGLKEGVDNIEAILGDRAPYTVQHPAPVTTAPQTPTPPPQQIITYGPDNIDESNSETLRWVIWGIILFVVVIWLRIRYLKRRPDAKTFSAEGFSDAPPSETTKTFLGYLIATGWALFWVLKFAVMVPVFIFSFIARFFGGSSRGGGSYGGGRSSGGGASGSW